MNALSKAQQKVYAEVLKSSRVVDILRAVENEEDPWRGVAAMNDLKQVCDGRRHSVEANPDAKLGAVRWDQSRKTTLVN